MKDTKLLIELYSKASKHSNYQILPTELRKYINEDFITTRSRYENERLSYILDNVDVNNKIILDIGANSGFFSFELINKEAKNVYIYEGNTAHTDFIKYAAELIGIEKKLIISNSYYDFLNINDEINYDVTLLLNVLHHIGDDFGDITITLQKTKENIINNINSFSKKTEYLIFQLGFNWKGDKNKPLFLNGTKKEMIDFLKEGLLSKWNFIKIGIPVLINNKIIYRDCDEKNIIRDDSLGEFLNRPLFILKTKFACSSAVSGM
jgi:SAM-dependent methyltransferase